MLNSRSLANKLINFQSFTYSHSYSLIAVTETWLSNFILDKEILPYNYAICRNDRSSRGGGVLLAIHNSVPFRQIEITNDLEIVAIEILTNNPICFCVVYIPPSATASYHETLLIYLENIFVKYNTIVVGDFNFADINWQTLSADNYISNAFCDFMFNHNLEQLIDSPTHRLGNILDLVITNSSSLIGLANVMPTGLTDTCDHYIITFSIQSCLELCPQQSYYTYNYHRADYDSMNQFFSEASFSSCLNTSNIELAWSNFNTIVKQAVSKYVPKTKHNTDKFPKWFTSEIRHLQNCIHTLQRKLRSHSTPHQQNKLEVLKMQFQQKYHEAKSSYEANMIHSPYTCNARKIFSYISNLSKSNLLPTCMCYGDQNIYLDLDKVNSFNNYFHSIFTKSSPTDLNYESSQTSNNSLSDIHVTYHDVLDALSVLDTTKAMGPDDISPGVLKNCAATLCIPIHHLFSLSLSKPYILLDWKVHCIIPIYKSGDKQLISNYRPISLLCIISKVLEKLIYKKIITHILPQLSPCQFGFLPQRSCLQQLLLLCNTLYKAFESTEPSN